MREEIAEIESYAQAVAEQAPVSASPRADSLGAALKALADAPRDSLHLDDVVVDVGAMGSHAMIVSRELGIPCAAGVSDATSRIPDGTLLEVDGSSGKVTVLEG